MEPLGEINYLRQNLFSAITEIINLNEYESLDEFKKERKQYVKKKYYELIE